MNPITLFSAISLVIIFSGCNTSTSGTHKQEDEAMPHDTSKGESVMLHDSLTENYTELVYICPCGGCPEVKETKPGNCPKCGMELVEEKK